MTDSTENLQTNEIELLTFRVGDQEYAVDIMSVREIRGWTSATPLPHAPSFVRGVINLRGTVLTIVDLSERLGMGTIAVRERNVIIVVQTAGQNIGLLVDAVSDILSLPLSALQPPPEVPSAGSNSFVSALTIVKDRMVRVLDLNSALPCEPLEAT